MGDRQNGRPKLTPEKAKEKVERADRLADEMRKNLIKRKQQQLAMKSRAGDPSKDADNAG
jgi:isocitrate dehydrogenase